MNRTDMLISVIESERIDLILGMITDRTFNINALASWGDLPLNVAIIMGNMEIVEMLLRNGADPNLMHKEKSPLQTAIGLERFEIALFLVMQQITPINPDARFDNETLTPLMMAADNHRMDLILALLEAGANRDLTDKFGCMAADRMPNQMLTC